MMGFCNLLAGNKARTEVLPLPITRARSTYIGRYQGQGGISYQLSTADKISS